MQPPAASTFQKAARLWAMLAIFVMTMAITSNFQNGNQTDFISFWAAAKLALQGNFAGIYDIEQHRAVQIAVIHLDGKMPFPYPPPYILAVLPFGLLSYPMAHAAWVILTASAYVAAARKLVAGSAWLALAFPPAIICGIIGQNSFLAAAIMMLALAHVGPKPFKAGLIFGLLIFKPHLGILIPVALIAGREWRIFAGATVSTLGLMLGSLVLFGWASWTGFFALLPLYGNIAADGLVSWNKMASVYAALRLIGVPEMLAWIMHGGVALSAVAILWRTWATSKDIGVRGITLVSATLLISPYLYVYDQMILFAAIALLWQRGIDQRWLFAIYGLSILSLVGSFVPSTMITPSPLVAIIPLVLVTRLWAPIGEHQRQHGFQTGQSYQ
jgi:Glycosyltransferase family 87